MEERDFLEEELLAAFLTNRAALAKALAEKITPDLFQDPANRLLAQAVWRSYISGRPFPPTKEDLLETLKSLAEAAGASGQDWPALLATVNRRNAPLGPQLAVSLDLLKARYHLGLLGSARTEIDKFLADLEKKEKIDAARFCRRLISQLGRIAWPTGQVSSLEEEMTKFYQQAGQASPTGQVLKLGPNFPLLEQALGGGLRPGSTYLLLSSPQRGKTTLALGLSQGLAETARVPVLYVSWTEKASELVLNLLARESRLERQALAAAGPIQPDSPLGRQLLKAEERLGPWASHLHFVEADETTDLAKIELTARYLEEKFSARPVLIIDSLANLPGPGSAAEDDRLEQSAQALQQLARRWQIPIVILAGLNRQGCQADQKDSPAPPTSYDLEGPVEILYGCDSVLLLRKNWPLTKSLLEKTTSRGPGFRPGAPSSAEVVELVLEKNRFGRIGKSLVQFLYLPTKNLLLETAEAGAEIKKSEAETQLLSQLTVFLKKLGEEEGRTA